MKRILIIIDSQLDFIIGSLAVSGAEKVIKNLTKFLKEHIYHYDSIMFTKDWHIENHPSFKENGGIWPKHCVQNSYGSDLPLGLYNTLVHLNDHNIHICEVHKGEEEEAYSAFTNIDRPVIGWGLDDGEDIRKILNRNDEIDVCGIAGDYCVKESVKDLIANGYENINMLNDCIASINEDEYNKFVKENSKILKVKDINSVIV